MNKDKIRKEKIKEAQKRYYYKNKEKRIKNHAEWYAKNTERMIEYRKTYNQKNKKRLYQQYKLWCKNNPEKYYIIQKRKRDKRRGTPQGRLRHNISNMISRRLKKRLSMKKKTILDSLPYTIEELKLHLERQFKVDMTWKSYGKWHIDHIKPDCLFNYKSVEDKEFQECWSLNNLQPLWGIENLIKGNKY